MFNTKVHQTLTDKGNADEIERNGPFPAEEIGLCFLGRGYYFWDDHINLAHWWGSVHCNNQYVICEAEFKMVKEVFYDLLGSRQDQIHFMQLIEQFGLQNMAIGKVIEFLKDLNSRPNYKGLFPYKAIRAVDTSKGSFKQKVLLFVNGKRNSTNLTPKIIICLIEKSGLHLSNYRIVHPQEYVQ